jgi:hypothetical protein
MQASQLKPASSFAQNVGFKAIAYGPPGEGKTPLIKTAPRPVMLICEPGMLSMRDAHNIPAWEGYTPEKCKEFFDWLKGSNEAKNFDTVCVDSFSQYAEILLKKALATNSHGLKAYGEMATNVMNTAELLFFMPQKHVYLIAKQAVVDEGGVQRRRPYFPGQELNVRVPHLFDAILHVAKAIVPGAGHEPRLAIRTRGTIDVTARIRTHRQDVFNEFEPPNLAALIAKAMAV